MGIFPDLWDKKNQPIIQNQTSFLQYIKDYILFNNVHVLIKQSMNNFYKCLYTHNIKYTWIW